MAKNTSATAADVRAWGRSNTAMIPSEALRSLAGRGRLHPALVAAFNKNSGKTYAEGNEKTMPLHYHKVDRLGRRQPRVAHLPVSKVRTLAGPFAGSRGRFSEKALAFAGEQYTAEVN